jgi:hypothetical protein
VRCVRAGPSSGLTVLEGRHSSCLLCDHGPRESRLACFVYARILIGKLACTLPGSYCTIYIVSPCIPSALFNFLLSRRAISPLFWFKQLEGHHRSKRVDAWCGYGCALPAGTSLHLSNRIDLLLLVGMMVCRLLSMWQKRDSLDREDLIANGD